MWISLTSSPISVPSIESQMSSSVCNFIWDSSVVARVKKTTVHAAFLLKTLEKQICCWLKSSAGFYTILYELIGTYGNL